VSTANTIGYGSIEKPGHEGLPARFPFTKSGYALSKTEAQELVLSYAHSGRINTIAVNPTFMIGPYDAKPSSGRIITMTVNRKLVPVPPGGKNFVDVRDVAAGICNALEKGKSGNAYLMAGENLSYDEFYSRLEKVCGRSFIRLPLAPFIMEMLGTIGSLLSGVGLKISLSRTNAKILCVGNYYTGEKAAVELGMPHTPMEKSIADALDWFAQNGMVKY
jgi:nucleoside-diphosphate-sugar epimerase